MLPVNYGSFLTLGEAQAAKFNFYKPLIKLCFNGLFLFSLCGFLLTTTGYLLTLTVKPHQQYDINSYNSANNISKKVTSSLSILRAARPQDINICVILDRFLTTRPKDVSITSISVRPDKYTVKGCASSVDRASAYSQAVLFGNKKIVSLNDVKNQDDVVYWTIDVTTKEEKKGRR